jgi:hypothetical protein
MIAEDDVEPAIVVTNLTTLVPCMARLAEADIRVPRAGRQFSQHTGPRAPGRQTTSCDLVLWDEGPLLCAGNAPRAPSRGRPVARPRPFRYDVLPGAFRPELPVPRRDSLSLPRRTLASTSPALMQGNKAIFCAEIAGRP